MQILARSYFAGRAYEIQRSTSAHLTSERISLRDRICTGTFRPRASYDPQKAQTRSRIQNGCVDYRRAQRLSPKIFQGIDQGQDRKFFAPPWWTIEVSTARGVVNRQTGESFAGIKKSSDSASCGKHSANPESPKGTFSSGSGRQRPSTPAHARPRRIRSRKKRRSKFPQTAPRGDLLRRRDRHKIVPRNVFDRAN